LATPWDARGKVLNKDKNGELVCTYQYSEHNPFVSRIFGGSLLEIGTQDYKQYKE
jgi:hypothetical protein